jgi:hypothetical protein
MWLKFKLTVGWTFLYIQVVVGSFGIMSRSFGGLRFYGGVN